MLPAACPESSCRISSAPTARPTTRLGFRQKQPSGYRGQVGPVLPHRKRSRRLPVGAIVRTGEFRPACAPRQHSAVPGGPRFSFRLAGVRISAIDLWWARLTRETRSLRQEAADLTGFLGAGKTTLLNRILTAITAGRGHRQRVRRSRHPVDTSVEQSIVCRASSASGFVQRPIWNILAGRTREVN